jgi:hypothetical protein
MESFPLYETFWVLHVVPLTYRVIDPGSIYVRSAVRKELKKLATASYGVFIHLAACHQQLGSDPDLFAAEGICTFYSHLFTVGELVKNRFSTAVHNVLCKYSKTYIRKKDRRLDLSMIPGLSVQIEEAFAKTPWTDSTIKSNAPARLQDYRHEQVHYWGFPVIGGKIPRREYFYLWRDKDLGELDAFLKHPGAEVRFATEFVDAVQQAEEDLKFVEIVTNRVWQVALNELDAIKNTEPYMTDQKVGEKELPPSRLGITIFSSSSFLSSSHG